MVLSTDAIKNAAKQIAAFKSSNYPIQLFPVNQT